MRRREAEPLASTHVADVDVSAPPDRLRRTPLSAFQEAGADQAATAVPPSTAAMRPPALPDWQDIRRRESARHPRLDESVEGEARTVAYDHDDDTD